MRSITEIGLQEPVSHACYFCLWHSHTPCGSPATTEACHTHRQLTAAIAAIHYALGPFINIAQACKVQQDSTALLIISTQQRMAHCRCRLVVAACSLLYNRLMARGSCSS